MTEPIDRRTFIRVATGTTGALAVGIVDTREVAMAAWGLAPAVALSALVEIDLDAATPGCGRGFAAHFTFGSYAAEAVEVSVTHGAIRCTASSPPSTAASW